MSRKVGEKYLYDVIVVGGGHAGIEASHIAAKIGKKTLLITGNIKNIGDMPCNPSIGGTAKGIIVREVDALGGLMGHIADISHIQIKMLNNSKGPAVRSLRAQADKITYPKNMQEYLMKMPNLEIKEALVEDLIVEDKVVKGVITENNETAALFMNSLDSACVYHNASTRFSDGGEFGFGAELGISTQKLHARGPLGLKEMCSYQYKIEGNGQIRE